MRISKALHAMVLALLWVQAGHAALLIAPPGEAPPEPSLLSKLMAPRLIALNGGGAPCSAVGDWIMVQAGTDMTYDVNITEDLTGTIATPVCPVPHSVVITPTGLDNFLAQVTYSGPQPEDFYCTSGTWGMSFSVDCQTASVVSVAGQPFDGVAWWVRSSDQTITASPRYIPADAVVQNRKVRISSALSITLKNGSVPSQNTTVLLQSSRGVADDIDGPNSPTDAQGMTSATVSTVSAPGNSTISIYSPTSAQGSQVTFDWLPAVWSEPFLITCYVVALEENYAATPTNSSVPGLPGMTLRQKFVDDTRMQGSGVTLDGTYIHYDGNGRYSTQACAVTASTRCAVDGETAAVDPRITPFRSTIGSAIFGGNRLALDTGGGIKGNHIDEYYGTRRSECLQRGKRYDQIVNLIQYVQ